MAKANRQGPQKKEPDTNQPKATEAKKAAMGTVKSDPSIAPKDTTGRGKQSGKSERTRVGGTAVPGAKSTQPKEITATNPQQQQMESYNRTMRRRMEHLGTAPGEASTLQDQRRKRLEKRKKRIEERRQEVKKVAASGPRNITLGRRNTYFLIAVAVIIVVVVVIAIIINNVK